MRVSILIGIIVAALAVPGAAVASTIATYSFTQGGYTAAGLAPGTLTGTFTGTVEPNGYIALADLQAIREQFTFGNVTEFGYSPARFFSFSTMGGSSTLDLETTVGIGGTVCVGAVAAFGFDQCAMPGTGVTNGSTNFGLTTAELPVVTFVSGFQLPLQPLPTPGPTIQPQPQPVPISPVPEPTSLLLSLTGAAALGASRLVRAVWS